MYVIFEGCDGSGKDTQADMLVSHLTGPGNFPLRINEPDDTLPIGKLLRQLLASGAFPKYHAALFTADRQALQHARVLPALAQHQDVVCSRSFLSTLVYQQEQWPLEFLMNLNQMLPAKPDFLFILDVDPEEGLDRVGKRAIDLEVYEKLDIQIRNRQRYLDLAVDPRMVDFLALGGRIVVIPTTGLSARLVHARVLEIIGGAA